jgi:hypothetical protein
MFCVREGQVQKGFHCLRNGKQHYIGKDPKYTVKSSGQESLVHRLCIGINYANAMTIKKLPPAAHDLHFPNLRT